MAFVEVNPDYSAAFARQGLRTAEDFLQLSGVILGGHPDRHVALLSLDLGSAAAGAFLKKEHRVRWRDRLANAWVGFGLVSRSYREYRTLDALRQAGVSCPEALAAGEDDRGRAFLLLRETPGAVELRTFLQQVAGEPGRRRAAARGLGAALARIHTAGFDHPDLYSKHVLVSEDRDCGGTAFQFLDWQRSRRPRRLAWWRRWRDLAALDATISDDLAGPRDRLACLRAYLRHTAAHDSFRREPLVRVPETCCRRTDFQSVRASWTDWKSVLRKRNWSREEARASAGGALAIQRYTALLLRKRRIRELRQPPLPSGSQNLIWLDGEALCLTREFRAPPRAGPCQPDPAASS